MKKAPFILSLVLLPILLKAQFLTDASARFDDSFAEWLFYIEGEEDPGELKIRWQMPADDWTQWDYRIGEIFGRIEMKWKGKPDEWEVRGNNRIVTARTVWVNDFREWRILDGDRRLTIKTKWANLWDEWEIRDTRYGNFYMYTNFERDPRDWVIIDEMDREVSFEAKMMMMFIALFNSAPRR